MTSELLPEPETPVTHVMTPNGKDTSIFFRLFSLAPRTVIQPVGSSPLRWYRNPDPSAQISTGHGILAFHNILYAAGSNHLTTVRSGARSDIHDISPPHASYPRRALRRSGCCRDPADCLSVLEQLVIIPSDAVRCSARPDMYATPTRPEPICVARRIRCASPPDRVPVARRECSRYSSPTSSRKTASRALDLSENKLMSDQLAAAACQLEPLHKLHAAGSDRHRSVTSAIFLSATVTASAAGFSRCPPQALHTV